MYKKIWQGKVFLLTFLLITSFGCGSMNHLETETPLQSEKTTQPPTIRVSAPEVDAAEPAIAKDSSGNVFVAWVEHSATKEANVLIQPFDKNGKQIGEKVQVNPEPGQATAWRGDPPSVAVGQDGAVYVVWTARVAADEGNPTDIYLSTSNDKGRSFTPPVKVNDDKVAVSHGMHSLAVDKSGKVYVAWLDDRNVKKEPPPPSPTTAPADGEKPKHQHMKEPNREVFFAISSDGGKTFSANKKIADEVCPCCKTSLLAADDGNLYAGWRQVLPVDMRHIAVATSNDKGNTFSKATIVSDDQFHIEGCPVSGATLVADNNSLKVLWFTAGKAGPPGLYLAESKDNGKTFAPRVLVSEGLPTGTPNLLAVGNNTYSVVWGSDAQKVFLKNAETSKMTDAKDKEMMAGELPVATLVGENVITGYIKKEEGKRGIWLSVMSN